MNSRPDLTKAAALPPDALARALEGDHDEVDENLEMTEADLAALRPGRRRPGQRGPGKRPAKVLMTIRVEPATLAAWKATGPGWQSRVNDLLRDAMGRSGPTLPNAENPDRRQILRPAAARPRGAGRP